MNSVVCWRMSVTSITWFIFYCLQGSFFEIKLLKTEPCWIYFKISYIIKKSYINVTDYWNHSYKILFEINILGFDSIYITSNIFWHSHAWNVLTGPQFFKENISEDPEWHFLYLWVLFFLLHFVQYFKQQFYL